MLEFKDIIKLNFSIEESFDLIFNDPDIMMHMHKSSEFEVDNNWKNNKRTLQVQLSDNTSNIPTPLLNLLSGGVLRATVKQEKKQEGNGSIVVTHKVRPHFFGAELVKLRPSFKLVKAEDSCGTELHVHTRVDVVMPPPINNILETFIISCCKCTHESLKDAILNTIAQRQCTI